MHAQVRHGAHGRALLVKEPGAFARVHAPCLRPTVAERRAEGERLSDGAGADELAGLPVRARQALVLVDHEVLAALFRGGDHALAVLQSGGHGLFAQHMLACLQRRHGDFRMADVG